MPVAIPATNKIVKSNPQGIAYKKCFGRLLSFIHLKIFFIVLHGLRLGLKNKKTTQESNQIEKHERVSKKVVSQLLVIFYLTKDTKFRIIKIMPIEFLINN